jgi:hypothetical protein
MDIALMQQLAPHGLAGAAFEEHVIWHDDRRSTVDLQQGFYMLHEVQLLVAGGCPEVIPDNCRRLALDLALLRYKRDAGLLAERRVGQDHVEALARVGG